jgi:SAM-dependent methyltransferase
VDRSLSMLRYASERLRQEPPEVQGRANLLCAEMSQFALGQDQFRLALIPYNTLMHVDASQLAVAFANIGRHLAGDGQLFIDVVNPIAVEQTPNDHFLTLERTFEDRRRDELVVVMASSKLDAGRQRLHITWIFDATPRQGGAITRRVARLDYRYYFPHQLELALEEACMEVVGLFGNYRLDPYEEDAERLLLLARRAP